MSNGDRRAETLRSQAEELLKKSKHQLEASDFEDYEKIVHELNVYQAELELQNDELRETQHKLQASRNKYFELFDFAPIGYFTMDRNAVIEEVNLTGTRLLGQERIHLVGYPFSNSVAMDSHDIYYSHLRKIFAVPEKHKCELRMLCKNSEPFVALMESNVVQDDDGKLNKVLVTLTDITERKRREDELFHEIEERKSAQAQLKRSEEHFRRLIENLSDMITVLDEKGTIEYSSPSVEHILGYKPDELKGDNALQFINGNDLKFLRKRFSNIVTNPGATETAWFRIQHKDGSWLILESTAKTVSDESAEDGIILTSRDITRRKQVEEDLRTNRIMLLEAQRIARLGSWEWDIKSNKVFWSNELYRIFGFQPQEIEINFDTFLERVHPEDRKYTKQALKTAYETHEPFEFYHRIVLPDSQVRILHGGGEVVVNSRKEPVKMLGIGHDVTEQRRTEQEVRLLLNLTQATSEAKDFESGIRKALAIICDMTGWDYGEGWAPSDDDQHLEFCSAYFKDAKFKELQEASAGLTFEKKIGLTGSVWVTKKTRWVTQIGKLTDKQFTRAALAQRLGLCAALSIPVPVRIDGTDKILAVLNFFMTQAEKEDEHIVRLVTAVATQSGNTIQRKRTENALVQSEERFRGLVESSPDAIFIEQEGKIAYANPAALLLLGYTSLQELSGCGVKNLFHTKYQDHADQMLQHVGDISIRIQDTKFVRKDKRTIDVEFLFRRTVFEDKPAILGIARDITENKRLKEEKERMERLSTLGEFSASIAHEIRNPLGAIGLNCSLLSKQSIESKPVQKKINDIEAAANRIEQIIEDVLSFARPSTPNLETVDVNMILDSALDMIHESLEKKKIQVKKDYTSEKADVSADTNQITQVFINLYMNAIEAMEEEGQLTLNTRGEASEVVVSVRDNGCGISPDALHHIFEPFFTSKKRGTGLGMAIVSRILEQNKASIFAESEVGAGTEFTLRFRAA